MFAVASGLMLVTAGCGGADGGDGGATKQEPRSSKNAAAGNGGPNQNAVDSAKTIGELKGPDGIVVTLHSAVRDSGGFVTVSGTVTNEGSKPFTAIGWRSTETELKSRSSVSGATLVDKQGKKRYLVLRDTEGECLCTTGLTGIKPQESRPIFAQFPAPPPDVTEVDFQLPSMPTVSIEITG